MTVNHQLFKFYSASSQISIVTYSIVCSLKELTMKDLSSKVLFEVLLVHYKLVIKMKFHI